MIPNDTAFDQQTLAVVNAEFDYATDVLGFKPNLAGGAPTVSEVSFRGETLGKDLRGKAVSNVAREALP